MNAIGRSRAARRDKARACASAAAKRPNPAAGCQGRRTHFITATAERSPGARVRRRPSRASRTAPGRDRRGYCELHQERRLAAAGRRAQEHDLPAPQPAAKLVVERRDAPVRCSPRSRPHGTRRARGRPRGVRRASRRSRRRRGAPAGRRHGSMLGTRLGPVAHRAHARVAGRLRPRPPQDRLDVLGWHGRRDFAASVSSTASAWRD